MMQGLPPKPLPDLLEDQFVSPIQDSPVTKKKGILTFIISFVFVLLSCCSNTDDIEYRPISEASTNRQLGQNIKLAILHFPDKRFRLKRYAFIRETIDLVGVFIGGYRFPIRRLYSDQAITADVIDALGVLFEANGFSVKKYYGISDLSALTDERLAVTGTINEFSVIGYPGGRYSSPSLEAIIDIDVMIQDRRCQRTIWTGKVQDFRKMDSHGIFTDASEAFLLFNLVFSRAIEKAWIDDSMSKALGSFDKKPLVTHPVSR